MIEIVMNTDKNKLYLLSSIRNYSSGVAPFRMVGFFVLLFVFASLTGIPFYTNADTLEIVTVTVIPLIAFVIAKLWELGDFFDTKVNRIALFPFLLWGALGWIALTLFTNDQAGIIAEILKDAAKLKSQPNLFVLDYVPYVLRFCIGVCAIYVLRGIHLLFIGAEILMPESNLLAEVPMPFDRTPSPADTSVPSLPPSSSLETGDTEAVKSNTNFSQLHGNADLKAKLLDAANAWKTSKKNGVLLFGEPGTGKTAFAKALAGELKLKMMNVNIGSIASRFIGQTGEQLTDIFDNALRQAPCVLFIDEVDSVIPRRTEGDGSASKDQNNTVNTFLTGIDRLRNGGVFVVAATNFKDRLDDSAIRIGRFDFHFEVPLPDYDARKGLIELKLSQSRMTVDVNVMHRVTTRWGGFNVPRIQEAAERACKIAADRRSTVVEMDDFFKGLRAVQGNKAGAPENTKGLEDLYMDDEVKNRLASLATQFRHVDEIETMGGSFPKGVIFHGPAGTGKTSMAKALAKASGWTFIPVTGGDLLEDKKIKEIAQKASDLRPSIVFIDEADDILGNRAFANPGIKMRTNELLSIMDGAGMELHDVVWIAATNDLEAFDKAAMRRFSSKILLDIPGEESMTRMIVDWARKHKDMVAGDVDSWAEAVYAELAGLSPSDVGSILEAAINNVISAKVGNGTGGKPTIAVADVVVAKREMVNG